MTRLHRQAAGQAPRALGVVLILVCFVSHVAAQAPTVAYSGSEIFCHILKHFKLEPISSIEKLADYRADETVIVIFGKLDALAEIRKQQPNLDGVALLLASDHSSGGYDEQWRWIEAKLEPWQLMIEGSKVLVNRTEAYQGRATWPMLLPDQLTRNHPVFKNIQIGLALNGPSYLESTGSDLHLVARFPKSSRTSNGQFNGLFVNLNRRMIGYAFGTPAGSPQRTLILAGHGVFMNGMIAQSDNDNGLFAINTVRWLRDRPQGKRKYALMIHDGKVIESFDLPLTAPPQIPLPPVRVINQMLRELENEGIFHRFLEEVLGWPTVVRIALMALTLGLLVYGVARLFPSRHRQEAVPLIIGLQPPPIPGRTVLEQRQFELLGQDNLWEPAQAIARQWFLDHAGVDAPLWDEAADARPPTGQYRAGWWARQKLAQQVAAVWSYAVRDPAARVSLREFRKLAETLQSLNHAAAAGQVAFPRGNPPAGP